MAKNQRRGNREAKKPKAAKKKAAGTASDVILPPKCKARDR
jgi:hypothetical protein